MDQLKLWLVNGQIRREKYLFFLNKQPLLQMSFSFRVINATTVMKQCGVRHHISSIE